MGELIGCDVGLGIEAPAPSVMLAALGPKMLELAGSRVDGTLTWMTGPKTLADHPVPTITRAAQKAGQPAPEIVCAFPLCVTDEPEEARAYIARQLVAYPRMPS